MTEETGCEHRGQKPGVPWWEMGPQREGFSGGQLEPQQSSATTVYCHLKQKEASPCLLPSRVVEPGQKPSDEAAWEM